MRRYDREITDYYKMQEIMEQCDCCRLGLQDEDGVYIVPLNFGYEEKNGKLTLYFHSAGEGKKIDLIRNQTYAAFEMDTKHALVKGKTACEYSYLYRSIMGQGEISLITDFSKKTEALQCIMWRYSKKREWNFREEVVNRMAVIKLEVITWSCKAHEGK